MVLLFAHICDICRFLYHNPKVRQVIREHYREKVLDVTMRFSMLNTLEIIDLVTFAE